MTDNHPGLVVEDAGLLTTVQDTGRWGYQHHGVSVSGAMDQASHRHANRILGNPASAATLEVTLVGPVLRFEAAARIAVSGAVFDLRLDRYAVSSDTVLLAEPGQTLVFGRRRAGARAYVAVAGGVDVPPVLGSRSTHLRSRMGGLDGRPLEPGDRVPLVTKSRVPPREAGVRRIGSRSGPRLPTAGGARVRVLPGPHTDRFAVDPLQRLGAARYTIRPESDRMGYRLDGAPIEGGDDAELLSQGLPLGSVQAVPSGSVIVAMADRQTTGGYPRIATVISADMPLLGQLAPGDWLEFERCDYRTAHEVLMAAEEDLAGN